MTQPRCAFGLKRFYKAKIAAEARRESSAETVMRRHRDDFAHTQKDRKNGNLNPREYPVEILSKRESARPLGRTRERENISRGVRISSFSLFLCVREIVTMTTHHGFLA